MRHADSLPHYFPKWLATIRPSFANISVARPANDRRVEKRVLRSLAGRRRVWPMRQGVIAGRCRQKACQNFIRMPAPMLLPDDTLVIASYRQAA